MSRMRHAPPAKCHFPTPTDHAYSYHNMSDTLDQVSALYIYNPAFILEMLTIGLNGGKVYA